MDDVFSKLTGNVTLQVLSDVYKERSRQLEKWGVQHHPEFPTNSPPGHTQFVDMLAMARLVENEERKNVTSGPTWLAILEEELFEAYAEADKQKRRKELVETCAVIVAWIEDMDSTL